VVVVVSWKLAIHIDKDGLEEGVLEPEIIAGAVAIVAPAAVMRKTRDETFESWQRGGRNKNRKLSCP
jgi:hypothetical protein